MRLKRISSILLTLILIGTNVQAEVIDSIWVGGSKGCWCDPCNWDPPVVPDGDFNIVIDSNYVDVNEVEVGIEYNRSVNELHCYGKICLANWTSNRVHLRMIEPNGLTNHGNLIIRTDEFTIDGSFVNYGYLQTKDTEFKGNIVNKANGLLEFDDTLIFGDLYNHIEGQVHINDNVDIPGGTLTNEGLMLITPTGEIWAEIKFINSGNIQMYLGSLSTGLLQNLSIGEIRGAGIIHANQLIKNEGRILARGGGLLLHSWGNATSSGILQSSTGSTLSIETTAGDFINEGMIQVNINGSTTIDCNFVNDPNGAVLLKGGSIEAPNFVQTADANFAGFGSITGDVVIDPNGLIELTGPMNIIGDVNIPDGAALEISDGQTLITGHTTCDGTIRLIGGTVIFQGGCDCEDCTITHEAGTGRNHFDINSDGTVNFDDFAAYADTWLWQASWY